MANKYLTITEESQLRRKNPKRMSNNLLSVGLFSDLGAANGNKKYRSNWNQ